MSFLKGVKELWDHLRGKGPAAAVALTLDLNVARDNKPYAIEAGGLIVETCTGDLYARINGPNGDGINLRYVRKVSYPFSGLFLSNAAQLGQSARILLLPAGMDADCPNVKRIIAGTNITISPTTGVGEVTISSVGGALPYQQAIGTDNAGPYSGTVWDDISQMTLTVAVAGTYLITLAMNVYFERPANTDRYCRLRLVLNGVRLISNILLRSDAGAYMNSPATMACITTLAQNDVVKAQWMVNVNDCAVANLALSADLYYRRLFIVKIA